MKDQLDNSIVRKFKDRFELNCILLLVNGYHSLKLSCKHFPGFDENDLTVQLVGCMKKNPMAAQHRISIVRESYEDTEDTYAGKIRADESSRVDIKYMTWGPSTEYEYRMEAKNLALKNFSRPGQKNPVNALALRKRYIETGIANFLDGTYGDGCLLGYIREGAIGPIVEELNRLLLTGGGHLGQLRPDIGFGFDDQYSSRHDPPGLLLKHFFLDFCKP